MNRLVTIFAIIGLLTSCNSSDKSKPEAQELTKTKTDSTSIKESTLLKAINTDQDLIVTALMAAPEISRAGAKIIGYNMAGEFVTLREGNNEFIILADDPKKEGFSAACYHKNLEPFMARGRALKAEGKKHQEIFDIREEEVKSGKLEIPTGSTLHIYYGPKTDYNPKTSKVDEAIYRYVVYMPFATAESTGLPEAPLAANHPWIMNPGTHRAHIMISPAPETQK